MSKAFTKESDGDDEDDLPEDVGGAAGQRQELHDPGGLRPHAGRTATRCCARSGRRW